jgi:PAS domain S-box-containing protein
MNINSETLQGLKKIWANQIHALDQSAIVAITDIKGQITYVNQMFCDLSEFTSEETVGKTHKLINSGFHDAEFFKDMWGTISKGQVWRGEVRNKAKSGRIYWVDTTIVPILGDDEKPQQYIAIRYDITSRKVAELELGKERRKLLESEKMASLGVLSAGIAHELGNPLGAIRGRLEMLQTSFEQDNFEKAFAHQSVIKMIDNVDRMSKIIRGLKSFSRDGSKDAMQEFSLNQLIGDIIEISTPKCHKHGIEIRTKGFEASHLAKGRESEIGQIFVNLFNNAFDAVKNDERPWISVEVDKDLEHYYLHVLDSGRGVSDDVLERIFDPFFTTKEVGQGTGLGLSICRSFAEGHGGRLFYNKEKEGSCFTLELPMDPERQ